MIKVNANKVKKFCDETVAKLGRLVGEVKVEGIQKGFSEDEVRKIWKTIFEIMNANMK
jgi:hypothetical protein